MQLGLGFFQVTYDLLVRAHVTQDSDGANDFATGVAQGGGIQGCRNDLSTGTPRVKQRVSRYPALDNLAQGGGELAQFFGTDEARQ